MKTTCQHCKCCYNHQEVSNAHTVYEKQEGQIMFSSIDDDFGVDICQVCYKPPLVASLWYKIVGNTASLTLTARTEIYPEVAVAIL
jgi:hypothetical protein